MADREGAPEDLVAGRAVGDGGSFVAGIMIGTLLGAGLALLFAPERGEKTRRQMSRRLQTLREGTREGFDRAEARARRELQRRRRQLRERLR